MNKLFLACMATIVLMGGCSTCKPVKEVQNYENQYFKADLRTDEYHQCFMLKLKNKSDKNIAWSWSKTAHVANGMVTGKFTQGKPTQIEDDVPVADILIYPGTSVEKMLCPLGSRYLLKGYDTRWNYLPCGDNTIYLAITIDGKEIVEKLGIEMKE